MVTQREVTARGARPEPTMHSGVHAQLRTDKE